MSITDELRNWFKARRFMGYGWQEIYSIADRIDAEYQKVIRERNDFADELSDLDETSVLLPVDADGEVIHLGDRVENNERVVRIVLTDGSWEPSVYIEKSPNVLQEYFCNEVSHYHKPAVEDVLLEACKDYHGLMIEGMSDVAHDMPAPSEIIAKYAAKLRLAEDGEGR